MKFVFNCRNYRGLKQANFEPEGVCALVGANGSGKTTLLKAFEFIRNLYVRSTRSAVSLDGGLWGLRNLNTNPTMPVEFRIDLGGCSNHNWLIQLRTVGVDRDVALHEYLLSSDPGKPLVDSFATTDSVNGSRFKVRDTELPRGDGSALKLAWEATQDEELSALVRFVDSIRIYHGYKLSQLREHGSRADSDLRMYGDGENIFAVLRNWRDRRDFKDSYKFVTESLQAAFADFFEELEFTGDAQTVKGAAYLSGLTQPMPMSFVPDGLLVALLHLVAIAGAPNGSFVAIDDFENYLHPFAIRSLIESIRGWARKRDLCVLIATHSPVALDEFRQETSHVFVMDGEASDVPVSLDQLRDPEWLENFSLGNLYSNLEFGAPPWAKPKLVNSETTNEPVP